MPRNDVVVWVVSSSAVLSAAFAAGLGVIGWVGARPTTAGMAALVERSVDRPSFVLVADEHGTLPEPTARASPAGGSLVAIASRSAARSLLLALEHGALVVDADQPLQAQLRAVDRALAGEAAAPDRDTMIALVRGWASDADRVASLTARESEVLDLLMSGSSAQAIAARLVVSLPTVRTHIRTILHKLGVSSQLAAAAIACQAQCGAGPHRCKHHQI